MSGALAAYCDELGVRLAGVLYLAPCLGGGAGRGLPSTHCCASPHTGCRQPLNSGCWRRLLRGCCSGAGHSCGFAGTCSTEDHTLNPNGVLGDGGAQRNPTRRHVPEELFLRFLAGPAAGGPPTLALVRHGAEVRARIARAHVRSGARSSKIAIGRRQ